MKLQRKNLVLSNVEKGNNLMLTRLTPVATLNAAYWRNWLFGFDCGNW